MIDRRTSAPDRRVQGKLRVLISMMQREIPPEAEADFEAFVRALRTTNPRGVGEA